MPRKFENFQAYFNGKEMRFLLKVNIATPLSVFKSENAALGPCGGLALPLGLAVAPMSIIVPIELLISTRPALTISALVFVCDSPLVCVVYCRFVLYAPPHWHYKIKGRNLLV